MPENTNLVVGAGITGAVVAQLIAEKLNQKVLLIDKKAHIAGNCYDWRDKNGITVHKYGSHIFHTNNKEVWEYLNRFCKFNTYMHKVYALIDGIHTTIPFNFNTLYDIFPSSLAQRLERKLLKNYSYNTKVPILDFQKQQDEDLKFLAEYIYNKVFLNYTKKQWGLNPDDIDNLVTARVPVFLSRDNRYFQDCYQGIAQEGYTKMIENMISAPNIEVLLETDFSDIKENSFKRVFYTGSIDEFFNYKYGVLDYRSVYFEIEEHNREYYQNNSVVNYPNNYNFTRIHEFKYYLNEKSSKTVISKEYSENFKLGVNERFYPVLNDKNSGLYKKYAYEAKSCKNIHFLGRLGDYKYYDMDKAVIRAFECFDNVFQTTMCKQQ